MFRFTAARIVLLIALMLAVSVVSVEAQTPAPTVKLVQAQSLTDLSPTLRYGAVSPDGSSIAWGDGEKNQLCFLATTDQQQTCQDVDPKFKGFGRYSNLSWSPDGKTLVFTEDPFIYAYESDIWTYDVASGSFQDRTDDNVFGGWIDAKNRGAALIDYVPTWNPANGDLYFFRSPLNTEGDIPAALELLPLARTEPKTVVDFATDLPVFSVYRPPAISSDGTQLAIIVLAEQSTDPRDGIWVVNLKDGTYKQVMTIDQLNQGLPDWAVHPNDWPEAVQWAGNKGLVVWAENQAYISQSIQASYYVDLAANSVTPMQDFTSVPDIATFYVGKKGDTTFPADQMPRQGVVSPDGSTYWFLGATPGIGKAYVWSQSLPPDGTAPTQIGEIDSYVGTPAGTTTPFISADGKHAQLYGYWLTFG